MLNKGLKEVVVGLLGGVLFYLAFSKYNLYYLIFPALFLGLRREKLTFFTFGFTSFFLSLWWLRLPVMQTGEYPYFYAVFGALFIVLGVFLIQFGLTFLVWKLLKFNWYALPFIYVLVEILRSYLPFSGFPWLLLGTTLVDIPLLKYSLIPFTVYGGSLITIFLSLLPRFKKGKIFILTGVILITSIGHLSRELNNPPKGFKVAIVQPNTPQIVKLNEEAFKKEYPSILELLKKAHSKQPDLIILPESSLPFFLSEIHIKGEELLNLSQEVPIILGILEIEEPFIPYNSAVLLYEGKVLDKYRKHILVPFGEYTPFPFKLLSSLVPYFGLTNYERGEGAKCFKVKGVSIGTPICFEVAYPFYIKKFSCNLIAVLTNDAWFLDSDGTHQHMKIARVRALENSTYILWVNNTGPSAVISPEGKVLKELPYGERGVLFFSF